MKLSRDEEKMLKFLRKQHEGWRVVRWMTVVGAVIPLLIGVGLLLLRNGWSYLVAPLWIALSAGCMSYCLGCWSGRPAVSLLLRLVEESIRREEDERKAINSQLTGSVPEAAPRINTSVSRIRYNVTLDDLVAFNRHHSRNSPYARKTLVGTIVFLAVLSVSIGWAIGHFTGQPVWTILGVVAAAVFAVGYPRLSRMATSRMAEKLYSEGKNDGVIGRQDLEIVDDGVISRSQVSEGKRSWDSIHRVETTEEHGFIYVGSISAFVIPKGSILEGNFDVFMDAVKQHIEARQPTA